MLKIIVVVLFLAIWTRVGADLPNIHDYCRQLLADTTTKGRSCNAVECRGRPGKSGPAGDKGDKGDPRTSERLQERVLTLEAQMKLVLASVPETQIVFCSMGMKSREVMDSAITASSISDHRHAGHFGRLDEKPSLPNSLGIWCVRTNRIGEWIQIDLGRPRPVAGVVTQGRPSGDQQWVTSYKIGCGDSSDMIAIVNEFGREKVFAANNDESTKVTNMFSTARSCRYVRLYPQTWNRHICLRMELLRGDCFA